MYAAESVNVDNLCVKYVRTVKYLGMSERIVFKVHLAASR